MSTAEEEFMSGGAPSCTFPDIGTKHVGTVVDVEKTQQIDFKTQKPKFYDDSGEPMMQFVITLQTNLRDPEVANDDGKRRLFAKGQMKAEIARAVKAAGATRMVGGQLAVRYDSDGPVKERGLNPPKQYVAEFAPGSAAETSMLAGASAGTGQPSPDALT